MTSMYLSPLLAGSRARSCGPGWGREGEREGSTEARLPVAEGSLVAPTVPHTQGRPSAEPPPPGTHSSPTWARPGRARSQRPPARPLARPPARWGRGPRARGARSSPAAPLRPAPRGPPGRGRHRGSVSRYLHEGLYRAFGRVQVGGAQMAALVHRGRRVYQEQ